VAQALVLLDASSNCLWAYNESAREVLGEHVERGGSSDEIAADLSAR